MSDSDEYTELYKLYDKQRETRTPLEQCVLDAASLEDMRDGDMEQMEKAALELDDKNTELKQLEKIAVLAMQAVEEMGFVELKGKAKELDRALANDLSDELWERINAAALKAAE